MTQSLSKVLENSIESIEQSDPLKYWHAAAASTEGFLEKMVVSFAAGDDIRKLKDALRAVESYCKVRKEIGDMLERSVCNADEFDPWSIEIQEAIESRAVVDAVQVQAKALPMAPAANPEDLGIEEAVPMKTKKEAKQQRNKQIMKMHTKGERPGFIADAVGATKQTVYRVIRVHG